MKTLERKKIKITLYKVREILLKESSRGYYRNEMNIKEIIDLGSGNYMNDNMIEYNTHQKMNIYENGYFEIYTALSLKKKK